MTEEKVIKEMAKIIVEELKIDKHWSLTIAETLIKDNYRKIPEGSVVLTREEYETLKLELAIEKKRADESYTQKEVEEIIASKERIKSKETAREILKEVGKTCGDYQWFKNLCKQYGVEVEE